MKVADLIKSDIQLQDDLKDDDKCSLCATHDAAKRTIDEIFYCPHCGHEHHIDCIENWMPVGEWYADPDEDINLYPIYKCSTCGKEFALAPLKIIHNYNHDVYYTGKNHVLPKYSESDLVSKLIPHIDEYIERKQTEKYLSSTHLSYWIAREMEQYVINLIQSNVRQLD